MAACAAVIGADTARFEGTLAVEWVDDDPFTPRLRVLNDFSFRQANGKLWTVLQGERIDGRALPPLLREYLGAPFSSSARRAAVVYAAAARDLSRPWDAAQRMFYEAARVAGVLAPEAKVMYLLLRVQGLRWEIPSSSCYGHCHKADTPLSWWPSIEDDQVRPLVEWAATADPSLPEIEARALSAWRTAGPHMGW